MAFFDNLKKQAADLADKAKELADSGVSKAKELGEISKLKMQNATERDTIRKAYLEMGKLYYAQYADSAEAPFAEFCQQITDAKAKIAYNDERIADIKSAGNLSDEDFAEEASVDTEEPPADDTPVE